MRFEDTGLPEGRDSVIRKAFNFSWRNARLAHKEVERAVNARLETAFEGALEMAEHRLSEHKELGADAAELLRQGLREEYDEMAKEVLASRAKDMRANFVLKSLRPAAILLEHASSPTDDMLAASILIDNVRSPRDFASVRPFGPKVATIVSDILHAEHYAATRNDTLATSSADARRVYMSRMITALEFSTPDAAEKENPRNVLASGQSQQNFETGRAIWGNDPKLEARFIEAFNAMSAGMQSGYEMQRGEDGALQLTKGTGRKIHIENYKARLQKEQGFKPKRPKPPGNDNGGTGSGSLGGNVF